MTMFAIVFTACWVSTQPAGCVTKEHYVSLSPMPSTNYVQAQAWIADWLAKHPGWCVPKWRVESGRGA
jgi:hypothetical protein